MTAPATTPPPGLAGLLAERAGPIPLGEVLDRLGARGHGPILLTLAILMMLPTGMLPLMPALTGALLALTALQMIVGGAGISIPARLARVPLDPAHLRAVVRWLVPLCRRLGRVLHPRFGLLVTGGASLLAIALILLASALAMILIGAIPGVPFLLCIPALLFGLGLTAGDGALVAAGFAAFAGAAGLVGHLTPRIAALWGG